MDNWERISEKLLRDKKAFYSVLNLKDITDVDYRHAKRVFKVLITNTSVIIMICMLKLTLYYLLMYLRILKINALKYIN